MMCQTKTFKSRTFTGEVDDYFNELLSKIDIDKIRLTPSNMTSILHSNCYTLTRELIPESLEMLLWSLRSDDEILQIKSDYPWIPWEIFKIRSSIDSDNTDDDLFLCEAFALTRWPLNIADRHLYLPLHCIALVGKTCQDTAFDEFPPDIEEANSLKRLEGPDRTIQEIPENDEVSDYMASGRFDGWHLIGHGEARGEYSDNWSLRFGDDNELTPGIFNGEGRNIGKCQPLVFLNACQTGRAALSLTRMGGWAENSLNQGSGAFIGTLWSTHSRSSGFFAKIFYDEFISGIPIGDAVRRARLATRENFPNDLTWLAYTVFAHPLALCSARPGTHVSSHKAAEIISSILLLIICVAFYIFHGNRCHLKEIYLDETPESRVEHNTIQQDIPKINPKQPEIVNDDQSANSEKDTPDKFSVKVIVAGSENESVAGARVSIGNDIENKLINSTDSTGFVAEVPCCNFEFLYLEKEGFHTKKVSLQDLIEELHLRSGTKIELRKEK